MPFHLELQNSACYASMGRMAFGDPSYPNSKGGANDPNLGINTVRSFTEGTLHIHDVTQSPNFASNKTVGEESFYLVDYAPQFCPIF